MRDMFCLRQHHGGNAAQALKRAGLAPAAAVALRRVCAFKHQIAAAATAAAAVPWLCDVTDASGARLPASKIPTDVDAIITLAGGQTDHGSGLPTWVERRLDTCRGLQQLQTKACPILCLGGGTPHKPPILNAKGYVIHESTGCAAYLMAQGCDPASLLKEVSSYDTVGNAYFSLTIHSIPAGWRKILVNTSDFHMPRTRALFRDMYALAARDLLADANRFQLTFVSSTDEGLFDGDVLTARHSKEAEAVRAWESYQLQSFANLHWWMHQTHLCYAVPRQNEFGRGSDIADPRLLASY